ncbi:MAG: hypothetical protein ACUVWR_05780 [Anaerolineae bacterium]
MVAEIRTRARRRDRWVSWIVFALVVVALLLGWGVKAAAEGRTVLQEVEGVRVRYPAGWVKASVQPPLLLQVEQLVAPFRTTLTLQRRPLPPEAANPLSAIQQALALERARSLTAYRVLSIEEAVSIGGRTGMRVTFAYVETHPNPFLETAPVVMHGEDYLFQAGNEAQIVTLTAAEANYARARKGLLVLVRSLPK